MSERLLRAVVISFDATSYTATVRYEESLSAQQASVPVARHLMPWMLKSGDTVAVLVFDENIAGDRVIVSSSGGRREAPMCRAYHDTTQSLADSTETALSLNQERYDTDTMHDTSTNNSRITIKTAGRYHVGGNVGFAANAVGLRGAQLKVNGSTGFGQVILQAVATGERTFLQVTADYTFAVNDYVEIYVVQTSGGSLNSESHGNRLPELWVHWIGI